VTGVTTNPTIFAAALDTGEAYDAQMRELAASGADVDEAIRALTTDDVRNACDVMAETYRATKGKDGRVSIEVSPLLAMDTDATGAEAADLWKTVERANVLVKIPATRPGLPAITATIADGISVNVTLIFSLERYQGVIDAYMSGLEHALARGHNLSTIHSGASFFVSRVDTEVDKRLDAVGSDEAKALKGKSAIANARLAYDLYAREFESDRWRVLEAKGANRQRPRNSARRTKAPRPARRDHGGALRQSLDAYQFDGGSLAGKDCRPHSSTMSSIARSGGGIGAVAAAEVAATALLTAWRATPRAGVAARPRWGS
jgi:transaldolase